VPRLNPQETWPLYERLAEAIREGLVAACHDCSEGGLGVALAEMAFAGDLGFYADLRKLSLSRDLAQEGRTDKVLFSETNGRFIVEVSPRAKRTFQSLMKDMPAALIGQVREMSRFQIVGLGGRTLSWSVEEARKAFTGGIHP
jgi:phosphoribosylformylglycinamidine synthase